MLRERFRLGLELISRVNDIEVCCEWSWNVEEKHEGMWRAVGCGGTDEGIKTEGGVTNRHGAKKISPIKYETTPCTTIASCLSPSKSSHPAAEFKPKSSSIRRHNISS